MLIRLSGAISSLNLTTMSFMFRLEDQGSSLRERCSMPTERVFYLSDLIEIYLTGGFFDLISKFISCTMYIEEVIDTLKDQFIRYVLTHAVV